MTECKKDLRNFHHCHQMKRSNEIRQNDRFKKWRLIIEHMSPNEAVTHTLY